MSKRINLTLPDETIERVEALAEEQSTTVTEVLRKFVNLGLMVDEINKDAEQEIIVKKGRKSYLLKLM